MRKCSLFGIICAVLVTSSIANACESAPPAEAFIYVNDLNLDGTLDISEWKNAKISDNFKIKFKDLSEAEFKRLDTNKNKKLEWEKDALHNEIEYIKDPCELLFENLENNETR